jgi:ISXO2-like transposase domain
MQHSKLPLTTWFWAAYVMATQPRGIAARQLQHALGLGSYKTAWLLCAKLRHSMMAPDPTQLSGLVEIDKIEIAWRSRNDPVTGGRRRKPQRTVVIGAVEVHDLRLGRICLSIMPDYSATSLYAFLRAHLAPGATAKVDEWSDDCLALGANHDPVVISVTTANKDLPGIHRVFSEFEVWALSVHRGLRRHYVQAYVDEFVFRFNHRRVRDAAFRSLLGVAAAHFPVPYAQLVSRGAEPQTAGLLRPQ